MTHTPIRTKLTELLGVTTPVVSPAMAYASGGSLAAEVSLAGGFGFIGVGAEPIDKLRSELTIARSILKVEATETLPIGVGLLGWIIDKSEAQSKDLITLLFEHRVKAIWLSFGERLGFWVEYIRELSQKTGHNALIFIVVSSLDEAQRAINEWKADVIVAQGIEAGGHGATLAHGLPLLTLLPLILAHTSSGSPPILGAGGLANGSQMAALLTLGASGAVFGTRFLTAPESLYSPAQRALLLSASSSQSVRTMAFDEARGTVGWPKGIDGRGIRNATSDDYEKGVDVSIIREKYKEAVAKGDTDRIVTWAGSGVGLIEHQLSAKDVVRELHAECLRRLNDARNLITLELTGLL